MNKWIRPVGVLDQAAPMYQPQGLLYPALANHRARVEASSPMEPKDYARIQEARQSNLPAPAPVVSPAQEQQNQQWDAAQQRAGVSSLGLPAAPDPLPKPQTDADKMDALFKQLEGTDYQQGNPFYDWLSDFGQGLMASGEHDDPMLAFGKGFGGAAQGKKKRDALRRSQAVDAIKMQIQRQQLKADMKTAEAQLAKANRPELGSQTPRPATMEEYIEYKMDPKKQTLSFDRYGQPQKNNIPADLKPVSAVSFTSDAGDQIDAVPGTAQYDNLRENPKYWLGKKPASEKGFTTFHNPIMNDDGTYEQQSVPKTGNEGKRLATAGWINSAAPNRHYGSETFINPEGKVTSITQGTPDWEAARKKGSGYQQIAGLPKGGKIQMIDNPDDPRLKGQNPGTVAWETIDAAGNVTGFNMKAGPKPTRVFKPVARADYGNIEALKHLSQDQLDNMTVSRSDDGEIKTKAVTPDKIKRGLTYYNPATQTFKSVREGSEEETAQMDAGAFKVNYQIKSDAPSASKKSIINDSINNDVHGMRLTDDALNLIEKHGYIFGTAGGIKRGIQSIVATGEDVAGMAANTAANSLVRSATDHLRSQQIAGNLDSDVADWFNPDLPRAKAIENALAYVWAVSQKAGSSGRLALYDLKNARDTMGFDDFIVSERGIKSKLEWLRGELGERILGKMETRKGLSLQEQGAKPKGLVAKKNADGTFSFEEQ